MLICGECTFLKESQEGLGGLCAHPEKEPDPIEVKVSSTTKETYDLQIGTYKFRSYESPCRHGFCDIWAARGSARLIWNQAQLSDDSALKDIGITSSQIAQIASLAKQLAQDGSSSNPQPTLPYMGGGKGVGISGV
jgi:hypothetical protein